MRLVAQAPFYRTEPVGLYEQPWYINSVIALESHLEPQALLRTLLALETEFGRNRHLEERWGPRHLDLDLLFHGDRIVNTRALCLPHPRLHQRRFVLRPLCDVAPHFIHPVFGKTVDTLLQEVNDGARVERVSSY